MVRPNTATWGSNLGGATDDVIRVVSTLYRYSVYYGSMNLHQGMVASSQVPDRSC